MHDLVCTSVELMQRLTLVFLELVPEGCLMPYSRYYCYHYPILLGIMYGSQLVVETLDISFKCFIGSLLDAG